ncbi:DUF2026 family protein [Methylomonas sp. MO1]|uniref:DUF2026 family protein n=1 Tax=Methylomonas sp. MO1 TaxID=3073619 RepID=UPI0028A56B1F|nr:DUF2026 family protein [Methylomonas sp. MO1]MDT4288865.1 DUF2026 family protein [Methylomonas sp. MO1]
MASPKNLVITLPDYERIFRVIHGVLLNERGDPLRACMYFSVIGCSILERYHRVKAEPVFGMAAYRLDGNLMVFAENDGQTIRATAKGFHCWIEVDGVAVDFQAPLFKDFAAKQQPPISLPRKMMQKRLDQAGASIDEMTVSGAHWYSRDDQLRSELLSDFVQKPANSDFIDICLQWYEPTPKKFPDCIQIGNQHGHVNNVPLSPCRISGAW